MAKVVVGGAEQMRELGKLVAQQLVDGDVVVLSGLLGAGKTTFSQGIGAGLGIEDSITSPTFVVARTHNPGTVALGLIHVDAYRLSSADDLIDLDIDSDLPHVTLIEWGENFVEKVTDSWLTVEIQRSSEGDEEAPEAGERQVTIVQHGPKWVNRKIEVNQ